MNPRSSSLVISKANGEKAIFEPSKLLNSLIKSGASISEAQEIVDDLTKDLYQGISTKKIYKKAFQLLKSRSRSFAARYSLKNAIMQLGPSGYPFEKFVGEILKCQGYLTQVAQIIPGKCVKHEVDVIAEKDTNHFMIECKYHNQPGTICDVKIPLYINSRFLDIAHQWQRLPGHEIKFHQGWVVTNTRFTVDAIQYGNCAGLKLVGWDYPAKGSLKDLIDALGLYPVTTLTSLTLTDKKALLDMNLVLCHDLQKNQNALTQIGIKAPRIKTILEECLNLCHRAEQTIPS